MDKLNENFEKYKKIENKLIEKQHLISQQNILDNNEFPCD